MYWFQKEIFKTSDIDLRYDDIMKLNNEIKSYNEINEIFFVILYINVWNSEHFIYDTLW